MADEGESGSDGPPPADGRPFPSDLVDWAKANAGLLGAGVLGATISLQLLGVSKGRLPTAFAILQAGGTATVATAALSSFLPFLALAGTVVAVYARFKLRRMPHRRPLSLAVVIGVLVCLTIVPVGIMGLSAIVGLVSAIRSRDAEDDETPTSALLVVLLAAWVGWAATATPWWPSEEIELRSGERKVAYVVGADAHDIVLLNRTSRLVERFDRDEVESRRLCSDSASWGMRGSPILTLIGGGGYPRCPDVD